MHLAEEQARSMGHEYLGTEHVLLGLLAQEGTPASATLRALGATLQAARSEAERVLGRGEAAVSGSLPLTPLAQRALEQTDAESRAAGHELATPEDLLLGLAALHDGLASRILRGMDVSEEQIRSRLQGGPAGPAA